MSPGRRPNGTPAETSTPTAAIASPTMIRARPVTGAPSNQLAPGKEIAELERRGFRGVGSVRRVALDGLAEILPDRAGVCLLRVRGAHQRPPLFNGIRGFEREDHGRTRRHEVGKLPEKRLVAGDGGEDRPHRP